MKCLTLLCLLLLTTALAGCAGPEPMDKAGFKAENTTSRIYAIRRAGEERDYAAVPHLIDLLDSSDPAERMFSIKALERITGKRYGYSPYDAPVEREQAITRWVDAYRKQQIKPIEK